MADVFVDFLDHEHKENTDPSADTCKQLRQAFSPFGLRRHCSSLSNKLAGRHDGVCAPVTAVKTTGQDGLFTAREDCIICLDFHHSHMCICKNKKKKKRIQDVLEHYYVRLSH